MVEENLRCGRTPAKNINAITRELSARARNYLWLLRTTKTEPPTEHAFSNMRSGLGANETCSRHRPQASVRSPLRMWMATARSNCLPADGRCRDAIRKLLRRFCCARKMADG